MEKIFYVENNEFVLLKKNETLLTFLRSEDLEILSLSSLASKAIGILEEFEKPSLEVHRVFAEAFNSLPEGYVPVKKTELFDKECYLAGDRLLLKEITEGKENIDLFVRYKGTRLVTAFDKVKISPVVAFFRHLHTVNTHRRLVRRGCFKVGLYWQGLTHDLSKYSPTEFLVGVRYYQGTRSPNVAERVTIGYSTAWLHHKGRNRHHQEYWTDYSLETGNVLEFVEMPKKYFIESIMDRIAACKVYRGATYNDGAALDYLLTRESESYMNKKNHDDMVFLFTMLRDNGEKKTFDYIKNVYLKK